MTTLRLILYAGLAIELLLIATLANGQARRLSLAGRPIKLAEPGP